MPNKTVEEVINRLIKLESSMQEHLLESPTIKADIKWLKWLMMLIVASVMSLWLKG